MRRLLLSLLLFASLVADECPTLLRQPKEVQTLGQLRLKLIQGWDNLLTWTLEPQIIPYKLKNPLERKTFEDPGPQLTLFDANYGYFSIHHPIVGIVTDSKRDIDTAACLLKSLPHEVSAPAELAFTTDEILAKVIAYRPLKKGMTLAIPTESSLETYIVDEVIDIWRGMPAFGLIPQNPESAPPILLFRGTDLAITTEKSWASILSDLDLSGPGFTTYQQARPKIRAWLKKMEKEGVPARVTGFSLGGVFTLYTLIYDGDLLHKEIPSTAFNPPGVSEELLKKWKRTSVEAPHITYVNQGDFVSQIGFFLGNVYEVTLAKPMQVIQAHTTLISAQSLFYLTQVDTDEENRSRK